MKTGQMVRLDDGRIGTILKLEGEKISVKCGKNTIHTRIKYVKILNTNIIG